MKLSVSVSAIFTFAITLLVVGALVTSRDWSFQARLFPLTVGIPALALCLTQLFLDLFKAKSGAEEDNHGVMDLKVDRDVPTALVVRRAANIFGWIVGLFVAVWLFGLIISLPLFVWLYLTFQSREEWWSSLMWTGFTLLFMLGLFHYLLRVPWPEALLGWPQETLLQWI
jgi:hypothetical protein